MHLHAMAREAVKTTAPVLLAVDRGEPARAMMSTFCLSTGGRASDPILPDDGSCETGARSIVQSTNRQIEGLARCRKILLFGSRNNRHARQGLLFRGGLNDDNQQRWVGAHCRIGNS
jgi:hypothetical protein